MCSRVSPSIGKRRRIRKEGENAIFFALAGSVCRQQFVGVMVGFLSVKSVVEHDGEG